MQSNVTHTQPPVIEYERSIARVDRLRMERDGDTLVVLIPPPALWRMIVASLSRSGVIIVACAALAVWALAPLTGLMSLCVLVVVMMAVTWTWQFTKLLRYGRLPTVIRALRSELTVHVPYRPVERWPADLIADLRVGEAGAARALLRYARIDLVLAGDRLAQPLMPYGGNAAMALIEDNLRDALGLAVEPR